MSGGRCRGWGSRETLELPSDCLCQVSSPRERSRDRRLRFSPVPAPAGLPLAQSGPGWNTWPNRCSPVRRELALDRFLWVVVIAIGASVRNRQHLVCEYGRSLDKQCRAHDATSPNQPASTCLARRATVSHERAATTGVRAVTLTHFRHGLWKISAPSAEPHSEARRAGGSPLGPGARAPTFAASRQPSRAPRRKG